MTIQKERPREQQPAELAESLLTIAEQHAITVEEVIGWIHQQESQPELSPRLFGYWAKAFDTTRAMQRKRETEQ